MMYKKASIQTDVNTIYSNSTELPLKKYKHFKGNVYELIDMATHSETLEQLIVYRDCMSKRVWIRPVNMFFDYVTDCNGNKVKRFELID